MDYEVLTDDDRRAFLLDRLRGLEAEHYSHVVALKVAAAAGEDQAALQQSLAALERGIHTVRQELAPLR